MNRISPSSNPIKVTEEGQEQEEKERARCEWDFHLSTVVSSATTREVSDTLGAIEFDPDDQFLATGGIARKIRIYSLSSLQITQENHNPTFLDHSTACNHYICTPAKLSSLRWKPYSGNRLIGSGDYDGVVTEYDLEKRVPVFERDEHDGRRVWSVDYSWGVPHLGASGSDDGATNLWDTRCGGGSVATVYPAESRSPVCCVQFEGQLGGSLIGLGCADKGAYVYDLRRISEPVSVFRGHSKTVTYVRFIAGGSEMVSAGTDGCLKLWDLQGTREIRTYQGHVNTRSFVGLSVWNNGGLLGCGSESNEVYVYDMRWGDPIWVQGFEEEEEECREREGLGLGLGFVSSVCWRQMAGEEESMIVAGGSNGVLQVYLGKKKPLLSS